jgi:ergothioneine biosynthesis protein EgtB
MHPFEEKALLIGHDKYMDVRKATEKICGPLETEDYVLQPITDVSPPKWHLGHTTWFFETFILNKFLEDYKPFHPQFNYIFNSYYESVGERVARVNRGNLSRPTVKDIMDYRRHVDENMDALFHALRDEDMMEFEKLFVIGLNHEQQHQELLVTDIKYILGNNPLLPAYKTLPDSHHKVNQIELEFLGLKGGDHVIGYHGESFAWDNEKPAHTVYVNDFEIANRLVTNGEYLRFIEDDGYRHFNHWLSEGWELARSAQWEGPLYWQKIDGRWMHYTLGGLKPVNLSEPVTHISFYEADAFASWSGNRLPTEAEWEIAARHFNPHVENGNFIEKNHWHPVAAQENNEICKQLFGDAWEWTYSGYFPYPGYEREEGALGEYNGKFMINQMVLRGGSCATPESHIRRSYRNFFQTDKRWQFTGIRLAR